MENNSLDNARRCYRAGLWGMVAAAICCFTPLLVIALGFIGLAAVTPYLDRALFPVLAFCLILAGYGWWRLKESREESKPTKDAK